MGHVFPLDDVNASTSQAIASQIGRQAGVLGVLVHPFSLGWNDESVGWELDHMQSGDLGAICGLPHSAKEYCRMNREFLAEVAKVLESSCGTLNLVMRDWKIKNFVVWKEGVGQTLTATRDFLELLEARYPNRDWLLVDTKTGWADPLRGWDHLTSTLMALGVKKLRVFGAVFSPSQTERPLSNNLPEACVNRTFRLLSASKWFEVELIEMACLRTN